MRILTVSIAALATGACLFLAAGQVFAQEPGASAEPAVYQVLRPGDRDLSCEQLAAEANSLNAVLLAQQNASQKGSGAGRQAAGNVAGGLLKAGGRFGLAKFGGRMGGIGGLVARAASDTAANTAGQAVAGGGASADAAPAPAVSPEQQRMNHLLSIYRDKSC